MNRYPYYFGIASYKRPHRQPMLHLLHAWGYPKEQIVVSTQTMEDYEAYSRTGVGDIATLIYRKGQNISDNKNTILDYVAGNCGNAKLVILSDKVRGINWYDRNGITHKVKSKEQMDRLVTIAYELTEQIGGRVWGCYLMPNTFYMKHTITTNMQMLGCFMGIVSPKEQAFCSEQPIKEDFEYVLRHVTNGRQTVRFNDVFLTATLHTSGGCHDLWNAKGDSVNEECTKRLLRKYPTLIKPHATRKNECRYIGPRMTIDLSITDYM